MNIFVGNKLVLLLGFILGFTVAIAFFNVTHPVYTSHNYSDKNFRTRVMEELDKKGFLYSYEIDHLKKHWITPHTYDETFYEDFLVEFCIDFAELCD